MHPIVTVLAIAFVGYWIAWGVLFVRRKKARKP